MMQAQDCCQRWNVRALLESTRTPFRIVDYGPRSVMFFQGDRASTVVYIEDGLVRVSVSDPEGREAVCGLFETGAFLGEEVLAGYSFRRRSAIAMTATKAIVVPKAGMMRLLHTQPAFADRFVEHVLARNARLEDDLTDQLLHGAEQRLARTLLLLAGCEQGCLDPRVLPDIPQGVIASMVGTTRSRVNFFMIRFRRLGFIERTGGQRWVNPGRLPMLRAGLRSESRTASQPVPPARMSLGQRLVDRQSCPDALRSHAR